MTTDIKLDAVDGNWIVVEGRVLKATATDLMLDAPDRRRPGGSQFRRALVHDQRDGVTVNFNGDYPGGVTLVGATTVNGNLVVTGTIEMPGGMVEPVDSRQLDSLQRRVDHLERLIESLTDAAGLVLIPTWTTMDEVENGDDMGISIRSAADLGLIVELKVDQNNPNFGDGDIISIRPAPGTIVPKGSAVVVEVNFQG